MIKLVELSRWTGGCSAPGFSGSSSSMGIVTLTDLVVKCMKMDVRTDVIGDDDRFGANPYFIMILEASPESL